MATQFPNENETNEKRPYEKPELRSIELVAEETLEVGCKTASGGSAPLSTPCTAGTCAAEGS